MEKKQQEKESEIKKMQINLEKTKNDNKYEETMKNIEYNNSINRKQKQLDLENNLQNIQIQMNKDEMNYKLKTLQQNNPYNQQTPIKSITDELNNSGNPPIKQEEIMPIGKLTKN